MTERLYYTDSYLREFEAIAIHVEETSQGIELILDRTAFYPTSGGQPNDLGVIGGTRLRDVFESDGGIVHSLEGLVVGSVFHCQIDWPRRFDHMQQHTGQHVLSQAFLKTSQLNTVGFHMGADYATIDLDAESVDLQQLRQAENLANAVVFENRAVRVNIVSPEEVPALGLRKESLRDGPLRVVEVEAFDTSACGGTHVHRTGEIGCVVIRKVERVNRKMRVEFVCGGRAVAAQHRDLEMLTNISRQFSVGPEELPGRVEKQLQELRELRKGLQGKNRTLAAVLARELFARSESQPKIVKHLLAAEDLEFLKLLAHSVLAQGPCIVLLGTAGQRAELLFALSDSIAVDLRPLVPPCCALIEGKGGGTRTLVQAAGKKADQVEEALALAEREIEKLLQTV